MTASLQALDGTLWLCEPHHLKRLVLRAAAVHPCPTARQVAEARKAEREAALQLNATGIRAQKGKVGIIPIHGPVDQRMTADLEKVGGTSLDFVNMAFDSLIGDSSVSAIVMHADSPGGSSYGTEELASKIFNARRKKPIYCIADSIACSAMYWLGSAAGNFICTPGGDVGSIGVYATHIDESKAMEDRGLTVTLVSAGKYKTEFASNQPLTDDARANLQSRVDECYDKFLSSVAKHRGTTVKDVRENYGEGRVFGADEALKRGMIDRVMSMDELLAKLTAGAEGNSSARKASVEILRLRAQQRRRKAAV